jgi:hypothetical protein
MQSQSPPLSSFGNLSISGNSNGHGNGQMNGDYQQNSARFSSANGQNGWDVKRASRQGLPQVCTAFARDLHATCKAY